jgi:uncharacterized protein (DUF983 family)
MAGRALLLRCPWCGGRGWTTGLLKRVDRCRSCGYRYERQPGFSLGATTMNIIVTFGLLAVVLIVGSVLTYPDLAVVPMFAVAIPITILTPILFYPFSYTLWAAADLAMRPLEPAELADAAAHVGSGT